MCDSRVFCGGFRVFCVLFYNVDSCDEFRVFCVSLFYSVDSVNLECFVW